MALTMNDYLTLTRVKHVIERTILEDNIQFEFWGMCLDELKSCSFLENKDE